MPEDANTTLPTPEVLEKPDPVLLGVTLPISTTVVATKQIADAWLACLTALYAALKQKATPSGAEPTEPAPTPFDPAVPSA